MAGVTLPSALPAPAPSPSSQPTTTTTIKPGGGAPHRSPLILAVAALLFSVMALCAKAASQHISGPQLAWLRFLIGTLLCLLPVAFGYRLQPQSYRALTLRGLFGSFAVLTYFLAISHLPVGIATLLNSSSPLFVALFSFLFLRERLSLRTLLALLLTAIGVVLVVLGNAQRHAGTALFHGSILWALLGLFSAILSGAAVTTVRSMRQTEGSLDLSDLLLRRWLAAGGARNYGLGVAQRPRFILDPGDGAVGGSSAGRDDACAARCARSQRGAHSADHPRGYSASRGAAPGRALDAAGSVRSDDHAARHHLGHDLALAA